MRWFIVGSLFLTVLVLPLLAEEDEGHDPFDGWSQKKVRSDARTQERKIRSRLSKWIAAKKKLAGRCPGCGGAGKKLVRRGRRMVPETCRTCRGKGMVPHRANWRVVHWDFMSPAFRTPNNAAAIEREVVALRRDPGPALREQITRGRIDKVIVHGNWATVKIKEWRGTLEMVSDMRWICCGSEWCIADDEADVDFPECRYPEAEDQPEVPPVTEAEIRAGFLKALELLEVEMEGEASDDLKSLRELRDRLLAGKR